MRLLKFMKPKVLSPVQFNRRVLATLSAAFPTEPFEATAEPLLLRHDPVEFGLQNLYSTYLRDKQTDDELDESVRAHFSRMLAFAREAGGPSPVSWPEAEVLLRPQFMPVEYPKGIPLVSFPFSSRVAVALVVDAQDGYSYVRLEDAEAWQKSPDDLYAVAVANLDSQSAGVEMVTSEGPERFIGIEAKDGYDAARLLLPGIRQHVTASLGSPCLAAIPNRDFLFFWSEDNTPRFHSFAREKIDHDFAVQPYPLTPEFISVTADRIAPVSNA
jgi:hypothetical protein